MKMLRNYAEWVEPEYDYAEAPTLTAAADRIEALEVENGRLREALEESLALNINYHAVEEQDGYQFTEAPAVIEAARAALGEKP